MTATRITYIFNKSSRFYPIHIVKHTGMQIKIQVHLALLCFAEIAFLHSEGLWQVYQHGFSNSICSLCVSVSHFGNSQNISRFFFFYGYQ